MSVPIILSAVCAVWCVFYIWTEYHLPPKKFFWAKAFCSLLFISVGIASYIIFKTPGEYSFYIIAALIMGLIGDLFLVFSAQIKSFIIGLVAFLIGQVIYGATFLKFGGFLIYDLLIYLAVVAIAFLIYMKSSLELGKMKIPVLFYVLIIAFMYTMAVSLLYKNAFNSLTTIFIVTGATLFVLSDGILAFVKFEKEPHIILRGANLALYYSAQVILALSIAVFS